MGDRVLKKKLVDANVYDLALERIREAYLRFDHVVVSFSGGKDSTVVLELAIQVARELGKLPVKAHFWDEEAIHPPTIAYVERTYRRAEVELNWLCVPVKHRNACSKKQPYWVCWDPELQHLWCREPPPFATRELAGYRKWDFIPVLNGFLYPAATHPNLCILTGIRADESLRRYMIVALREVDNWFCTVGPSCTWGVLAKPIYDWRTDDVWTAPKKFGWDHNETYDHQTMLGTPRSQQRVCPPFGEEPLTQLWKYAQAYPELWEKMIRRVPGAATAARYSNSPLYAMGAVAKDPSLSWKDAIHQQLMRWNPETRSKIAHRLQLEIRAHNERTDGAPIQERGEGTTWELLLQIATRGDLKHRKHAIYTDEEKAVYAQKDRAGVRRAIPRTPT